MEVVTLPLAARSLPDDDRVELWLVDMAGFPLDPGVAGSSRVDRLSRRRMQQQFFLRLLLGSYLGCPGRDIELVREARGKPALGGRHAGAPLRFNLAHSGDWLAVAVGRPLALGVDIERRRIVERAEALARRYFPAADADGITRFDQPARSLRFLDHWTAREALVKARGCGLAGTLNRIGLAGSPPRITRLPREWPEPGDWHLVRPELPDGLCGHVAGCGTAFEVHSHRLDGTTGSRP